MTGETIIERNGYHLFVKQINNYPTRKNPVLIFLHDSWGCVEIWEDFPEKLAAISEMNLLLYDRRGYGKSSPFGINKRTNYYLHEEADELLLLIDRLEIETAVLYGHSDGATIALIAASRYPKRITGLVLEGAHSFIEESGKDAVRASAERAKQTNLLKSLERFHGDKTPELFRLWHETWLDEHFADWTIVPMLKNITCPVLAFQGVADEFGTVEQLNILKKNISSPVTIKEIGHAAHTPRKENRAETMAFIEPFFRPDSPRLT
ncbi:MAG: alpha/beta hydrolase [Prevotellaceae bacterium]|jgi:pimeloyl-ACP methyl ester carboxylesterase|nr:alpha/beta hydrolase [Prevotellaceae bacterium]